MLSILIAGAVVVSPALDVKLNEIANAISTDRLDQAQSMIGTVIASGANGPLVDRLLADLDFKSGRNAEALARYKALLQQSPANMMYSEGAAIAALRIGSIAEAASMAERATAGPAASWRAWNARGVSSDYQRDWVEADRSYQRAAELAPDQAEVANNAGWSKLLRGQWSEAIGPLERAASLAPKQQRIADNLELARAAVDQDLPSRRPSESDLDWAARLNDAGVIAQMRGDKARAVAAFARAIEARGVWYQRAANNLKLAQAVK